MKILAPLTCMQCLQKDGLPNFSSFYHAEINDDFRYKFTCSKGHHNTFIDQSHRYETLFQIGATAIIDGYYRESISSFTASLERFYEFFITIKLMYDGVQYDDFVSAWSKISSQSERQLGAFIFLYIQHFKKTPTLINPKQIELRNNVIHKGKIPTKTDAIKYGQAVLDLISEYLSEINIEFNEQINNLIFIQIKNRNIDKVHSATMATNTILSNVNTTKNSISLEKELVELKKWRDILSNFPEQLNSSNGN